MIVPTIPPSSVLHKEGSWELISTDKSWGYVAHQGWQSVICHDCGTTGGPYWMILEYANTLTLCLYCSIPMPESIVALFKLQNWEMIK